MKQTFATTITMAVYECPNCDEENRFEASDYDYSEEGVTKTCEYCHVSCEVFLE